MATAFLNIVNSRLIHCKVFDAPLPAFCVQILTVHELCVYCCNNVFMVPFRPGRSWWRGFILNEFYTRLKRTGLDWIRLGCCWKTSVKWILGHSVLISSHNVIIPALFSINNGDRDIRHLSGEHSTSNPCNDTQLARWLPRHCGHISSNECTVINTDAAFHQHLSVPRYSRLSVLPLTPSSFIWWRQRQSGPEPH